MSKSWKAPDRPGSGTIPGEKAFGVALKPVGRNLTLDRGGNSSVTASKNAKTEKPESVAQIAKLKHVSKEQISPRSGSGRPSQTPAITCTKSKLKSASKSGSLDSGDFRSKSNSIKVGGFSLTIAEDTSRGSVKNGTESAEMSSPLKTPFHKSLTTRKNPASKFDPISGEITLDSTKVDKFMAEVKKSEKKTEERPWNVKLRSVETAETAVKRVTTAKQWKTSSTKNSELSLDLSTLVEKDNSRRPRLDGRAKSVPNYETKIFSLQGDQGKQSVQKSNTTKSKSEKEISTVTIKGDKQDVTGSKKGENGTKPVICSPKPVKASKKPAKQATKTFENDSNKERTVSPRGAFVLKLIEKCETRDEHKDSTHGNDVSPVKTPQFPNTLLEKLAVLEGLVSGSSSDDSDVSDEDGGYADVAAVIECLAEEGIVDLTRELGTLRRPLSNVSCGMPSHPDDPNGMNGSDSCDNSDSDVADEYNVSLAEEHDGIGGAGEVMHENVEYVNRMPENLVLETGLPCSIVQSYDWVDPTWLNSGKSEASSPYELATAVDWSKESFSRDIDKRKRRFAFKDKKNGKTEKAFIDRRSAPPLSPKHSEKEEENVYNSPEECPSVPDWDTGSSRMSMAESESTSSDSVMNNVNIQPHTVIELSDKQARKLKKRQPDSSSSAKWKKKWKQFYRRSQDLLDIPGLQTKLENLSLGQLPANVKQKLRDRMKKKKGRKSGHFEVNPVVDEDDFDEDFRVSSSEDLPSDAGEEDIYQSIDLIRNEKVPIVNVNIRMSSSPEKIPISPPVELDQTDSAPDLPPRSNTGSVYEKYSQLGPKVQPDTPPSLPKKSPKSKLSAKRGSLPGHVMLSSSLDEEAPPLPPRNSRLSLGNLDTRVPPQLSASPLAESYLRQPRLAEKFPSEDSPKPLKRDSLLLGKVPPPLHRPAGAVSSSPPKFGLGYLDMNQGEGSSSHESSPERSIDRSVPAPFSNVMDFKQRTVNRKPSLEEVDIDLELQVSVTRSRYKSRFEREPLYQYYDKDYINRQSWQRAISEDPSSEEKEDLDDCPTQECITPEISITISAESRPDDVTSTGSNITTLNQSKTSQRSLWSQVPEVISSGLLDTLTAEQKKEQEAMFEIITSEASYFKSLNVLINTFVMSPELCGDVTERSVISKQSKHLLFSNIGAVRDTTEKFLSDLEARWNEGVLISDISDIIIKHATENFDAYIKYCTNKTYQDRTFNSLSKSNPAFKEAVVRLQSNPDVQGLSMDSFFLLPMQRITRLPLLMDGVCRHREPGTDKHKLASQALDALSKLVKKCNEGAKVLEQTEQLWMIENQLDFKIKKVPIVSSSRHLVKEGELVRVVTDSSSKLPFGKNKPGKQNIYIFLFNDLLLVTKRKGENLFSVIDYTKRNSVHCEPISSTESCQLLPNGAPSGCKNLFLMAMLENHEGKQVEMVLACNSPSDRARWMEAVTPVQQVSDSEKIYEEWDCPQVQAIHRYTATQPDELDLEEADVVNVFRKMADGWFEGERIRDGERGWFPESYVEEILSSHVRARNLRIRYRLLVASKDFALRKS